MPLWKIRTSDGSTPEGRLLPLLVLSNHGHFTPEAAHASGLPIDLEVDGGVKPGTAKQVIDAGADVLVAGNAVFKTNDYAAAIRALREDS